MRTKTYRDDEIGVHKTGGRYADVLGPYTFVVQTGSANVQTYLTRDQLVEHVAHCQAALTT